MYFTCNRTFYCVFYEAHTPWSVSLLCVAGLKVKTVVFHLSFYLCVGNVREKFGQLYSCNLVIFTMIS